MQDFLVIGGGIAGLSAGAHLADLGSVTLVEQERVLGHHTSGRSAAIFIETYGLASTVALNRAALPGHRAMGALADRPRGLLLVARADREAAFAEDSRNLGMTEIAVDEAVALCPILNSTEITRAAWFGATFDIDTDRMMQAYQRRIGAAGGQILTGAPVTGLTRTAQGWRADTPQGQQEGRYLVNAAGAWVDRVAAMAGLAPLGFTPLRRSMARIPAPSGFDVAGWPFVDGAGGDWYMKADAGALVVSPSEEDPCDPHDAWADDMVLAEGLARYEAHVTAPVTRLLASWAGLRTFAPDRQLVIGPDPRDHAFLWCAGQGGYGFQTAPSAGALLADLAAGRAPLLDADLVRLLSPARLVRRS